MKIYISGKITGREALARREFAEAKRLLEKLGHTGVNPFDNGLRDEDPWEEHLAADIISLMECDAIYLLPGWEKSRGASLEYAIARRSNKTVFTLKDDILNTIWLP